MTEDTKKKNQLVKAKTSSLQKRVSNIISRGLSDLTLLDVEKSKAIVEKSLLRQAKEWVKKGYDFYKNKEHDKAIEAYTNAIALNTNYAVAYFNRGLAYNGKRQYDRAIEDYNNAIKIDPDLAIGVYYNCGMIYFYEIGSMDEAIENFDKLIELEPNDAEAYLHRGFAYNNRGDVNRAISDLQKACDLGSEAGYKNLQEIFQATDWFKKGEQYRVNKEYDKAIEAYTKAMRLNPNYINAYFSSGLVYVVKKQYDEAIEYFNEVIELTSNDANAYLHRGVAYEMLGNKNKAVSDYRKACDLDLEIGCKSLQRVLRQK